MEIKIDIDNEEVSTAIAQRIKGDAYAHIRDMAKSQVEKVMQEIVNDKVGELVVEALQSGVQKTNTFGDPIGEPISLKQMLLNSTNKFLSEMVDSSGRSGHSSYGTTKTKFQWIIDNAVDHEFRSQLKKHIDEARKAVNENMKAEAKKILADAVESIAAKRIGI